MEPSLISFYIPKFTSIILLTSLNQNLSIWLWSSFHLLSHKLFRFTLYIITFFPFFPFLIWTRFSGLSSCLAASLISFTMLSFSLASFWKRSAILTNSSLFLCSALDSSYEEVSSARIFVLFCFLGCWSESTAFNYGFTYGFLGWFCCIDFGFSSSGKSPFEKSS